MRFMGNFQELVGDFAMVAASRTKPRMTVRLIGHVDRLLTRDRLFVYPTAVLIAFSVALMIPWLTGSAQVLPDFVARWTASVLVARGEGESMYDPAAQATVQSAELGSSDTMSLFVSPPFLALICMPLGGLPYVLAALVWTALSVVALILSFKMLLAEFATSESPWHRRGAFLPAAASYPVIELVGAGQDTAFVLLAVVASLSLINRSREWLSGIVLTGALIKPHLVFLVLIVLAAKGRWRALISLAITSCLVVAVTSLTLGSSIWWQWLKLVFSDGYASAVHEGQAWKSASLTGLVGRIAGSGHLWVGALALLAAAAVMGTWQLVKRRSSDLSLAWAWALAAGAVTSPHTMIYDVVLMLPMVFAISVHAWTAVSRTLLLAWTVSMFMVAPLFALGTVIDLPGPATAPWHVMAACAACYLLARELRKRTTGAV